MFGAAQAALLGAGSAAGAAGAAGLLRPTPALVAGQNALPSGDAVYVATNGSDTTGTGTLVNPYKSLEKAQSHPGLGAGWTIVLRGGNHVRTTAFAPTKSGSSGSPITVMAYPGETVILDYGAEFAAFRTPGQDLWESENASLKIWRTKTNGQFGSEARAFGHWEEAGEWWQLYGYKTTSGPADTGTGADYYGPGVRIGSDGRLHIRFQRPVPAHVTSKWPSYQPGTSGGNWVIPSSENPNDYPIYLARQNGLYAIALNADSYWWFYDINVVGVDSVVGMTGGICTGILFKRGLWKGARYGIRKSNVTVNNLQVRNIKCVQGRIDYFSWGFIKDRHGATEMDNNGFINNGSGGGGGSGVTVEDCYVGNYFDVFIGLTPTANTIVRYNWFNNCHDDLFQLGTNTNSVEIGYNVCMDTPLIDWSLTNGSSVGRFYIHHNLCWLRLPRLWDTNQGLGCHAAGASHFASGATGRDQPRQKYNNTIIVNAGNNGRAAIPMGHCDGNSLNDIGISDEAYNNILMVYADSANWDTEENSSAEGGKKDGISHGVSLDGTDDLKTDYNHYARVLSYTPAHSALIGPWYDHPVRSGGPHTFTSAAAVAASGTNQIGAEVHGTSSDTANTGVAGMNAAAPFVDLEGLDFRPKAGSHPVTGAKDLSATGWPDATNAVWRGALDPNADGNEIGPRD